MKKLCYLKLGDLFVFATANDAETVWAVVNFDTLEDGTIEHVWCRSVLRKDMLITPPMWRVDNSSSGLVPWNPYANVVLFCYPSK